MSTRLNLLSAGAILRYKDRQGICRYYACMTNRMVQEYGARTYVTQIFMIAIYIASSMSVPGVVSVQPRGQALQRKRLY